MASELLTAVAAVASLLASPAAASVLMHNALAATPQMGWDHWNAFGCDVSEELLLGTAQRMVELGLRDAGYQYVILDDGWSDGRYPNKTLRPDFTQFPNGMKHVADQIHAPGLKFGMDSSAGEYTCGQDAGSLGYEYMDAPTFASWDPADMYGTGAIQFWAGSLSQGDYVAIFLNAANQDVMMNATLADVFLDEGYTAAPHTKQNWDMYDLWANRMPNSTADAILAANSTTALGVNSTSQYLYNATAQSYADGIAKNETVLMGEYVGMWSAGAVSQWNVVVPRHGVMAYRMRPSGAVVSKRKRDGL